MTRNLSIYTSLCALFAVLIVTSNLIYQKFVTISVIPGYPWEISVGAISYPLTFLITDLIAEFYGKEQANFCVKLGIFLNVFVALLILALNALEATPWSPVDNATFHTVFGFYSIAFIGSIMACYTAQLVDITLYLWIRKLTGERWLWLRNNGSTAISLFIDTLIVVTVMAFFRVIPLPHIGSLLIGSYSFKLFFTFCNTPMFYIAVKTIRYFRRHIPSRHEQS